MHGSMPSETKSTPGPLALGSIWHHERLPALLPPSLPWPKRGGGVLVTAVKGQCGSVLDS